MMTILYDNYQDTPDLETDWGFSCLIQGLEKTILFDTGAHGDIILRNMTRLQADPTQIDIVVLSHDHWDHTGGLAAIVEKSPAVTVFLHPSFAGALKNGITQAGAQYVEATKGMQICRRAVSTGEMGGEIGEQALAVETADGLAVITGCAHPGVVNMVRRAQEVLDEQVHLVVGGFHMRDFSDGQVEQVIDGLKQLGVQRVAPCHCSGERTRQLFASAFGEGFIRAGVGSTLSITAS